MPIESCLLIEPQGAFIFSTRKQHDFVTVLVPCLAKRIRKNGLPPTLAPMRRVGYDVFDYAVWAAATREVRNDGERATRDERAGSKATEVLDSRIGRGLGPNSLGDCRW